MPAPLHFTPKRVQWARCKVRSALRAGSGPMAPMASFRQFKDYLVRAWRQFSWTDLRWSHLTIVGIIAGAALMNLVLPNGWTVWPLVPVASAMVIVNEAADRNGQGVPPLQVYGFVALVLIVWSAGVAFLSKVPVLIQVMGFLTLGYFSVKGYLKGRQREQLIAERRA